MIRLRHPSVLWYLGMCTEPPALVLEYCARGSLYDILRKAKTSPDLAAEIKPWPRRLSLVCGWVGGVGWRGGIWLFVALPSWWQRSGPGPHASPW